MKLPDDPHTQTILQKRKQDIKFLRKAGGYVYLEFNDPRERFWRMINNCDAMSGQLIPLEEFLGSFADVNTKKTDKGAI